MQDESRISYLCSQVAAGTLSLDEKCELLGYGALEPEIFLLIEIETRMREKRK